MGSLSKALVGEIASYEDSEWTGKMGDDTITLYAKPLTPADLSRLGPKHAAFVTNPTLEGMVDLIILKARDGHGQLAFDKGDKPYMMKLNTNKVGDIFGALFGEQLDMISEDEEESADRAKK